MEENYVVVDVNGYFHSVYTFAPTLEDAELKALDAQCEAMETAKRCRSYASESPDNAKFWLYRAEQEENADYKAMTFDEFLESQRKHFTEQPITESTEEEYCRQFEVLPPIMWKTIDGVEMFCMSEFLTGTYTCQYARVGDKYYSAIVDAFDRSTWIYNRLPKE